MYFARVKPRGSISPSLLLVEGPGRLEVGREGVEELGPSGDVNVVVVALGLVVVERVCCGICGGT